MGYALASNAAGYISYPNGTYFTNLDAMTISLWCSFLPGYSTAATYGLAAKRNGTDGFILDWNAGNFRFVQPGGGGFGEGSTYTLAPTPSVWYHVVGVFNGSSNQVFVNGVAANKTNTSGSTVLGNTVALAVGSREGGSSKLPGAVDEFRAWDVALTADEIAQLFQYGTVPYRDHLLFEWLMDENTGSTAIDSSGNGRDGTINTMAYIPSFTAERQLATGRLGIS